MVPRRVIEVLYGKISVDELPRMIVLSTLLGTIISGFWLLDSLKDTVLATTVGLEHQPKAKALSVVVTLVVVAAYNSLIRKVRKPVLFYVFAGCYGCVFVAIGGALAHRRIGMENTEADPRRLIGWVSYFAIESYGSLLVALFWAFTNASMTPDAAESSYGLVVAFAALGAIFGSTLATQAKTLHISFLYVVGGVLCWGVCGLVCAYEVLFPEPAAAAAAAPPRPRPKHQKENAGGCSQLFDGFGLIARHSYVLLLLLISTLYEVVLTVLDFEMKIIGRARYGQDTRGAEEFARLMGQFGITVNTLSFFISLFGFSWIVRGLGLRTTLLVFPILCVVTTLAAYSIPSLWTLFVMTALLKALVYSLNEPALEMLYLPTSTDIKFKAKAWIDVVGARSAKAAGSLINNVVQNSPYLRQSLPQYGNVPTFVVSLGLLFVAVRMGSKYEALLESGDVVGEADDAKARSQGYELVKRPSQSNLDNPWARDLERLHSLDDLGDASSDDDDDDDDGGGGGAGLPP